MSGKSEYRNMILKLLKQLGEHKLNINYTYGILRLLQVLKRVKLREALSAVKYGSHERVCV